MTEKALLMPSEVMNHVNGLISFARQVNSEYVDKLERKHGLPDWLL